jgi:hypothetical protein
LTCPAATAAAAIISGIKSTEIVAELQRPDEREAPTHASHVLLFLLLLLLLLHILQAHVH